MLLHFYGMTYCTDIMKQYKLGPPPPNRRRLATKGYISASISDPCCQSQMSDAKIAVARSLAVLSKCIDSCRLRSYYMIAIIFDAI